MAFVNLPPNLQDMFNNLQDQINKLVTGPNQAMYTAESAQATSSQALQEAAAANAQGTTALAQATIAIAQGTQAIQTANSAIIQAQSAYALGSQSIQKNAYTITNAQNQLTAINGTGITVYSGASSISGARVVMNSAGLAGYDATGSATFSILASTGAVSTTGAIFTNSQISGGSLSIGGNCLINSSGYLTATGATITGNITATSGTFTGIVYASAGTFTGTITSSNATITGGSLTVGSNFQVNTLGQLTASSANVTGTITTSNITATGGTIGGWSVVGSSYLQYGTTYLYGNSISSTYCLVDTSRAINAIRYDAAGTTSQAFNTLGGITATGTGSSASSLSELNIPLYISISGGYGVKTAWSPNGDNGSGISCGQSSHRWSVVYAATGTINTSDARLKTDIKDSVLGLNFIKSLRPVSYKWISGSEDYVTDENGKLISLGKDEYGKDIYQTKSVAGKRTHWGLLAQEVKQAIDNTGVEDFAGWTLGEIDDPESIQGLRYEQFIAPIIKAIQELSNRLDNVEGK